MPDLVVSGVTKEFPTRGEPLVWQAPDDKMAPQLEKLTRLQWLDLGDTAITGPLADAKYDWYTNYGDFAGTNANAQGLKPPLRMRWASAAHDMDCDPGPIDGTNNARTRAALLRFRAAYGAPGSGRVATSTEPSSNMRTSTVRSALTHWIMPPSPCLLCRVIRCPSSPNRTLHAERTSRDKVRD